MKQIHLSQALLRAQELGMTGGDYVWLLYVRHPNDIFEDKAPWLLPSAMEKQEGIELNLTDDVVSHRRQAFYCLKMVMLWEYLTIDDRICIYHN